MSDQPPARLPAAGLETIGEKKWKEAGFKWIKGLAEFIMFLVSFEEKAAAVFSSSAQISVKVMLDYVTGTRDTTDNNYPM